MGVVLPDGEERESVVVPHTVQIILEAFNQLNVAIQALLVHAPPTINEVMMVLNTTSAYLDWCVFLSLYAYSYLTVLILIGK